MCRRALAREPGRPRFGCGDAEEGGGGCVFEVELNDDVAVVVDRLGDAMGHDSAICSELCRAVERSPPLLVVGDRTDRISDVVTEDRRSAAERAERGSYVGCIAGALPVTAYQAGLDGAGLRDACRSSSPTPSATASTPPS